MSNKEAKLEELIGKTLKVCIKKDFNSEEGILFETTENEEYVLYHDQECCESVNIDNICGELDWLIGSSILSAEEVKGDLPAKDPENDESFTWTFYKFSTIKGYVTIKFYGTSNGHYSESADFIKIS